MAFREHRHRYKKDSPEAGWALDYDTLTEIRLAGVYDVAVWVRDTGDIYLGRREAWMQPDISYRIDYSRHVGAAGQKGSEQRVLRFKNTDGTSNFRVLTGTHKVR